MSLVAGAIIFGCAAFLGIVLASLVCANVPILADGPITQEAQLECADGTRIHLVNGKAVMDLLGVADGNYLRPIALIVGVMALGTALTLRETPPRELGLIALLCVPLVAAWYSDWLKGIIPDWFTLAPLAVVVAGYVVSQHAWWVVISAVVPFVPFALAALFSKGYGMGWGDAKLTALGGAVLGVQTAISFFAIACFLAAVMSLIRDRGKKPIAFGPYLACAVMVGIAFQVHG